MCSVECHDDASARVYSYACSIVGSHICAGSFVTYDSVIVLVLLTRVWLC